MQKARHVLENRCLVYPYNRLSRFEHLHTRFEIIVPAEGCVHAQLDRKAFEVHPGEMLVIFPGVLHSFVPQGQGTGTMITFYAENFPEKGDSLKEMQPAMPLVSIGRTDGDVAYCLERLKQLEGCVPADDAVVGAYLTLLMLHLTPHLSLVRSGPAASKDVLYRAMKYISKNLARPLTLKETARALGVNSYYLSHVLSERIHMGFRAYLNSMRVDRARRYLRLTTWPVEEVASACGFGTLRTFDRVFLEHCGCTPREFRKTAKDSVRSEKPAERSSG